MRSTLILVALLTACAGPAVTTEPKPGQETALAIILDVYGVDGPAPFVQWVSPESLDCDVRPEGTLLVPWTEARGWINHRTGDCVSGLYHKRSNLVQVAWPMKAYHLADTTLAHEVCHAFFGDMEHAGACQSGGRIAAANAALLEAFPLR